MKLQPLGDRVLLEPQKQEAKTSSGIYLPEQDGKILKGKVIAIGDDKDIKVKVNDIVLYESYAGTELDLDGKKHLLIKAKEILAKLE
ncbi:MAG: co-chaperone GroES [Candidatus Woesearchaeota archaeon]